MRFYNVDGKSELNCCCCCVHRVEVQLAMFRQYRRVVCAPSGSGEAVAGEMLSEASEITDDSDTVVDDLCTTDETDVNGAVRDVVDNCWTLINQQCFEREQQSCDACKGWKTIRVFVSSTFSDMHSERELLVKKVRQFFLPKDNDN